MFFISKEDAEILKNKISTLKREGYNAILRDFFQHLESDKSFEISDIVDTLLKHLIPNLSISKLPDSFENRKTMEPLKPFAKHFNSAISSSIRFLKTHKIITENRPYKLLGTKEAAIYRLEFMRKIPEKKAKLNPSSDKLKLKEEWSENLTTMDVETYGHKRKAYSNESMSSSKFQKSDDAFENAYPQSELNEQLDVERDQPLVKEKTPQLVIDNDLIKKFDADYNAFLSQFQTDCDNNYNTLKNNSEAYNRFMAINKIAMSFSITYLPKKAKSLKRSEKNNKRDPNCWTGWPLSSHQRAHQFFRHQQEKYHGFVPAQLGSLTGVPLTTGAHDNYIFERSVIYNDKAARIKYLKDKYTAFVLYNDDERAANSLFMLFQHVTKQLYFLKKNNMRINFTAAVSYINEEFKKLGFEEIPEKVRYQLRKKFYKNLDMTINSKEVTKNAPIRKMEKGVTEKYENGVKILWLKKKHPHVSLKTKIDSVGNDDLIINENVDIYDADTGQYILSFRKCALEQLDHEIEELNTYLFMTTKKQLIANGVIRDGDEADPSIHPTKKVAGSMATGFLVSNIRTVPILSNATTDNPFSYYIESAKGKIAKKAESLYKEIAPEEFATVAEMMEEFNEFLIPGCQITTAGEFNFDKQTLNHVDPNQLPQKSLAFLTVFYGGPKKRYEGGYTYFSEYNLAIDVEQKDLLLANFEKVIHCNTAIKITDNNTEEWHRVPFIGFTRGELLDKATKLVIENSDDEHDITPSQIEEARTKSPKKQGNGSYTLLNMLTESKEFNNSAKREQFRIVFEQQVADAKYAYKIRNNL